MFAFVPAQSRSCFVNVFDVVIMLYLFRLNYSQVSATLSASVARTLIESRSVGCSLTMVSRDMWLPTHWVRVAQATLRGSFNDARVLTAMRGEHDYATILSFAGSASVWNADFFLQGWYSDVANLIELLDDDATTMALQSTAAMAAEDPLTIALFPKPVVMAESVESVGEAGSTSTISSKQSLLNLSMTTGMRSLDGAYAETNYPIEARCNLDCEFCGGVFAHMPRPRRGPSPVSTLIRGSMANFIVNALQSERAWESWRHTHRVRGLYPITENRRLVLAYEGFFCNRG